MKITILPFALQFEQITNNITFNDVMIELDLQCKHTVKHNVLTNTYTISAEGDILYDILCKCILKGYATEIN